MKRESDQKIAFAIAALALAFTVVIVVFFDPFCLPVEMASCRVSWKVCAEMSPGYGGVFFCICLFHFAVTEKVK